MDEFEERDDFSLLSEGDLHLHRIGTKYCLRNRNFNLLEDIYYIYEV